MNIRLHKNARTTPAIRREIQAATGSDYELAERFGVTRQTIRKWRKRTTQEDFSHTAHRLQTTLNAGQEEIVVELRKTLRLSLDDLLSVVREFVHASMSRSALDRLLRRRGVSRLPVEEAPAHPTKAFKAYEPGYLHIDVKYLPQMPDETQRRYLFVAIDRATRWVYTEIRANKTAASARRFLKALHARCPVKIRFVLTDNGKEFTDRLFGVRKRAESGTHEFDALCAALGIEHRLTRPKSPQTNGMVERFNGRISHVLNTNRFESGESLEQTLERYVWLYNHHLPQKALNHETPIQALKRWQSTHPELFVKQVRDRPGPDTYLAVYFAGVGFQNQLAAVMSHSTRNQVPVTAQRSLTVDVPPIAQQHAIAHILGTLDDKIELNRRRNQTLEAMARALFKDWFVDFGPVRAKMEGREPYLPADLWQLFPDRLDDEGKPEGWRSTKLANFASLNPESWTKKNRPHEICYVDLSNTKQGTIEGAARMPWSEAPSRAQRILRIGDTIVGTVRPGNQSFALISDEGLTGSTGFAVLRPQENCFRDFVFLASTSSENIERLSHLADGAAYPAVRPDVVLASSVTVPTEEIANDVLRGFANAVRGWVDAIEHNKQESRSLAQLRDTLLPKLISGELRIQDADKIVGAVA